jgi:NAD(P)-dependent dehydrogenase (short-subunit alcohol dehydrogenase family)
VPWGSEEIMNRLEGKVAVISGGTSGIGLAIAQRFVKDLILAARRLLRNRVFP